jgi:hypothetical protein
MCHIPIDEQGSVELTNAMSTGVLAIALGSELVTLITSPADSPSNRTCCTSTPGSRAIRMLPVVLGLWTLPGKMWVVDSYVMLKLL